MPFYQVQGRVPKKRHTAFRDDKGNLYYEEHMSREGFSGVYSNLYHLKMPTRLKKVGPLTPVVPEALHLEHRPHHLLTGRVATGGDLLHARQTLFFNSDLFIQKAHPTENADYFYRNGHFDELYYVQQGEGVLETQLGDLAFRQGDYIVIPRGVISKIKFNFRTAQPRLLVVESPEPIQIPRRYRNSSGQMMEQAPFSERDIRTPELRTPQQQEGDFRVLVRLTQGVQEFTYAHHPFDLVGWDGYHYPWVFNIEDFDPIVGRIHQPPPVHQTFEAPGFVICSFVSRPFDFHPDAVPAPYPHSNVDSDEILFYSAGDFMSRTGIFQESITYHPMGLAHGPQPGKYEASIGKKQTQELAVMIDTFRPLTLASDAAAIDDPRYALSWMEA